MGTACYKRGCRAGSQSQTSARFNWSKPELQNPRWQADGSTKEQNVVQSHCLKSELLFKIAKVHFHQPVAAILFGNPRLMIENLCSCAFLSNCKAEILWQLVLPLWKNIFACSNPPRQKKSYSIFYDLILRDRVFNKGGSCQVYFWNCLLTVFFTDSPMSVSTQHVHKIKMT